jgi:hypothetical protein
MRVLFGIILGVFVTVATAFIHDSLIAAPPANEPPAVTDQRAMVNWDVVGDNLRRMKQRMHEAWTALSHKVAS